MRPLLAILTLGVLAAAPGVTFATQATPPPAPAVKVGQRAPDFTLRYLAKTADGKYEQKTASLADFKGRPVILAFFPAAFSPG